MAASWAALLKSLQERQEGGKALTAAVLWRESHNDLASEPLMHACSQYLQAFERYVRAARAMNQAVGAVIFDGLDLGAAEAS